MCIWWLLAIISVFVCYTDIKKRKIENTITIVIFFLCAVKLIVMNNYAPIPYSIMVLVFGFVLHTFNILAAGDTKLFFAFSLAILPEFLPLTLFIITALGGVLAVGYYLYGLCTDLDKVKKRGIPYGVPICLGSLFGVAASF